MPLQKTKWPCIVVCVMKKTFNKSLGLSSLLNTMTLSPANIQIFNHSADDNNNVWTKFQYKNGWHYEW